MVRRVVVVSRSDRLRLNDKVWLEDAVSQDGRFALRVLERLEPALAPPRMRVTVGHDIDVRQLPMINSNESQPVSIPGISSVRSLKPARELLDQRRREEEPNGHQRSRDCVVRADPQD